MAKPHRSSRSHSLGRSFLVVAITGSIGSGKSTVAQEFGRLGAPVISADRVARQIVEPGTPALQEIVAAFGTAILTPTRTLDRKRLGRIIFEDPKKRAILEQITHPRIHTRIKELLQQAADTVQSRPPPPPGEHHIIAYEIPLYFESDNRYPMVDYVLVVDTNQAKIFARVGERDNLSRSEIRGRLKAQLNPKRKRELADLVIYNNGSLAELLATTQLAFQNIRRFPPRARAPLATTRIRRSRG